MKIISKFRDYYDSLQAHGTDHDLLLLRETVEHKDKNPGWAPLFKHFEPCVTYRSYDQYRAFRETRKWSELRVQTGVVLFVGKPYLFFHTSRSLRDAPFTLEERFIYNLAEIDALVQEHGSESIYEHSKSYKWSRPQKSWVLSVWELAHSKSFEAFASEMQAPIIYIGGKGWAKTYPRLADLQFYKVVDAWQAYQELSMFLGNIAAPDRVPVNIADRDRVQQHGFDMKYGFRTRPKEST